MCGARSPTRTLTRHHDGLKSILGAGSLLFFLSKGKSNLIMPRSCRHILHCTCAPVVYQELHACCVLCSSLLSNCKLIISGWSLPIRIVTFLSPVSGTLMSVKWGYFLISSLIAICLSVKGRLPAVETWLRLNSVSPSRMNLKVGPFVFTIDRRHRNTSQLHIIQI